MSNVDYKALYISMQQQCGDLSLMVDKYQKEIIPQYEQMLKAARMERDNNKEIIPQYEQMLKAARMERDNNAAERDAALDQLKRLTACYSCKYKQERCDSQKCHGGFKLWEWVGPQEVKA